MTLPTKIQYKNFERGEFTGKKESSYDETIRLIEQFPWDEQRDHLQVSLTNPSITLEDKEGNYLKLALYYEGQFVLHYLNIENQLYSKSLFHFEDAYPGYHRPHYGRSFKSLPGRPGKDPCPFDGK